MDFWVEFDKKFFFFEVEFTNFGLVESVNFGGVLKFKRWIFINIFVR